MFTKLQNIKASSCKFAQYFYVFVCKKNIYIYSNFRAENNKCIVNTIFVTDRICSLYAK